MATGTQIDSKAILRMASGCVVREQEHEFLFYNPRTDELHLVPPSGFFVYQLCDGLRSVAEIESVALNGCEGEAAALQSKLREFLGQLLQRGILEVDCDE